MRWGGRAVGSRAGGKIGGLRRSFLGGITFEGIGGWFLRMRRWMTEGVEIREEDLCKWGFSTLRVCAPEANRICLYKICLGRDSWLVQRNACCG